MRIATWNLGRPKRSENRRKTLVACMAGIKADVWVLTETHRDLSPGPGFRCEAYSRNPSDLGEDEHWTAIWVRGDYKVAAVKTRDAERTACLKIVTQAGPPLFVYGTVLPWLGDPRRTFMTALAEQEKDWRAFRGSEPDARFCVAGDLNQDLLPMGHYYGSRERRKALRLALEGSGLTCLTGETNDPVRSRENGEASIDHICISGVAPTEPRLEVWPKFGELGSRLTDHYGVAANLDDV